MDDTKEILGGVQLTLVGLFVSTFFDGVGPYPSVGVLLVVVGTMIVGVGLFNQ